MSFQIILFPILKISPRKRLASIIFNLKTECQEQRVYQPFRCSSRTYLQKNDGSYAQSEYCRILFLYSLLFNSTSFALNYLSLNICERVPFNTKKYTTLKLLWTAHTKFQNAWSKRFKTYKYNIKIVL